MSEILIEIYHNGEIRKTPVTVRACSQYALKSVIVREEQTKEIEELERYAQEVKEVYTRPDQPRFPHFPMSVKILNWPSPQLAVRGAQICVNKRVNEDPIRDVCGSEIEYEEMQEYLLSRIEKGEESVLEHTIMTIEATNISRAMLMELSRHRLISLSVQSTRWALKSTWGNSECVMPPALCNETDKDAANLELEGLALLEQVENYVDKLRQKYGNDTAKYFIPECTPTNFIMTANLREWRYIIRLRTAPNVLPEFQEFCHRVVDVAENSLIRGEALLGKLLIA